MLLQDRFARLARAVLFAAGGLGIGGGALLIATHPAAAASVLSAVTCSVTGTNSCVSGTNTSSGIGVYGTSNTGTGVRGNSSTNYGMKGTSGSSYGIYGSSTSGGAGIAGTMAATGGVGVYGYSTSSNYGAGVSGSATSGTGVQGIASGDSSSTGVSGYGPNTGTGVFGYSAVGNGVRASSYDGNALYATTSEGKGTAGFLQSNSGNALVAFSNGAPTIYGQNTNGNGLDIAGTYIGLIGRAPTSGYPLVATDSAGNDLFQVDGYGNVRYKGNISTYAKMVGGGSATAYTAKMTLPTVEDTGTAQLVSGAAVVRLDPAFAASIDPSSTYRVFITPDGETRGLFVAAKTPSGFMVRESQSGRSTVTFDYRIVATAVGQAGLRMSAARGAAMSGEAMTALSVPPKVLPVPKIKRAPTPQP